MDQRSPVVRIEKVVPSTIQADKPFKTQWSVDAGAVSETATIQVTFLTDDARLLLCDPDTDETPVERTYTLQPGERIRKETVLHVKLRKGLRNEDAEDGESAPLTLHARVQAADQVHAVSPGFGIHVANLKVRTKTKIFV